jgi:hypothetical protein
LVALIDQCLKKKAAERPQSAGDVVAQLDKMLPNINALPEKSKLPRRAVATRVITKKIG